MKKTLAVFLFLGFVLAHAASSEAYSGVAQFLNDRGKKLYKQGLITEAVREFSKTLLVDPDNKVAREYLRKLGSHEIEQPQESNAPADIRDLARHIAILEEEITYLESRPQEDPQQQDIIKNMDIEREVLLVELSKGKKELAALNEKLRDKAPADQEQVKSLRMHVGLLEEYLQRDREELARLRELTQSYENRMASKEEDLAKTREEVAALTGELDRLQQELKTRADDERKQAVRADRQLSVLRGEIDMREEAIAKLKQDLAQRNKAIADYEDQIRRLASANTAAGERQKKEEDVQRQRMADYEKALNAKEERIAALKKEVEQFKLSPPTANDETAFLKEELEFLKAEYESSIELLEEKETMIKSLAEQLAESKNAARTPASTQTANLRNQLEDAKIRMLELQTTLDEKNNDIAFLEQRLSETEQRLELVQTIIRQKDERIQSLEEQLQESRGP
jgi:chromosome segregation ATPase